MAYALDPAGPAGEELARVLLEQVQQADARLGPGLADDPVRAVHEGRKGLKRARSTVRLGRGLLGAAEARRLNAVLRDAGRLLSGARDADVATALLREVAAEGDRPREDEWDELGRALRATFAARGEVALGPAAEEARAALAAVPPRLDRLRAQRGGRRRLLAGLARNHRRGRAALRAAARAGDDAEARHDLRKRTKDTWHHLRLFTPAWPVVLAAEAEEAHRLSDLLGDDHDAAVLAELLGELDTDVDVRPALTLLAARRERLWDEALPLARRLYAERPEAFARRIGACVASARTPGSTSSSAETGSPTTLR